MITKREMDVMFQKEISHKKTSTYRLNCHFAKKIMGCPDQSLAMVNQGYQKNVHFFERLSWRKCTKLLQAGRCCSSKRDPNQPRRILVQSRFLRVFLACVAQHIWGGVLQRWKSMLQLACTCKLNSPPKINHQTQKNSNPVRKNTHTPI